MILGIVQARLSSRRLPGKVMRQVLGRPLLELQLERLARASRIDRLIVATSDLPDDDPIAALATAIGCECFRGSLDDVLDRYYCAARSLQPRYVVRLTADCPLADPEVVDQVIEYAIGGAYDYATNALEPTFPDGLDVEVMTFAALEKAWRDAKMASEREHVTPFIHRNRERFRVGILKNEIDLSDLRWTVDEPEDLELVRRIYESLYPLKPEFTSADVLRVLEEHPEWRQINRRHERNAGSSSSAAKEAGAIDARLGSK